jgi:hypothetical protein
MKRWLWAYTWQKIGSTWRRTADIGPLKGMPADIADQIEWGYLGSGRIWLRLWQWMPATWGTASGEWVRIFDAETSYSDSRSMARLRSLGEWRSV